MFGQTKKSAKTFEGLDTQVQQSTNSWFISPYTFTALAFADTMEDFSTTTAGTLYASTPSSSGRSAGSAAEGSRAAAVVEAAAAAGSPTEWAPAGRRVPLAPTR